jgi:ribosomal protein L40E
MSLALQDFPLTNDPDPAKVVCRQCAAAIDADDNYCRRCGSPTPCGVTLGVSAGVTRPATWESPWVILPLILFVLGPLALPLLWRSRQFTSFWKILVTVLVTVVAVLLIAMSWVYTRQALSPLLKALEIGGF